MPDCNAVASPSFVRRVLSRRRPPARASPICLWPVDIIAPSGSTFTRPSSAFFIPLARSLARSPSGRDRLRHGDRRVVCVRAACSKLKALPQFINRGAHDHDVVDGGREGGREGEREGEGRRVFNRGAVQWWFERARDRMDGRGQGRRTDRDRDRPSEWKILARHFRFRRWVFKTFRAIYSAV